MDCRGHKTRPFFIPQSAIQAGAGLITTRSGRRLCWLPPPPRLREGTVGHAVRCFFLGDGGSFAFVYDLGSIQEFSAGCFCMLNLKKKIHNITMHMEDAQHVNYVISFRIKNDEWKMRHWKHSQTRDVKTARESFRSDARHFADCH